MSIFYHFVVPSLVKVFSLNTMYKVAAQVSRTNVKKKVQKKEKKTSC